MTDDVKEITRKIKIARRWAKKHFNAAQCHDERIVDEELNFIRTFFVEFPDADTMRVSPACMGEAIGVWFEYRLSFNPFGWQSYHPIWGYELPLLEVPIK